MRLGKYEKHRKKTRRLKKVQIIERDVTSSREGGGMARVRD